MANENSTTQIDTVAPNKAALITDLNSSYIGKEQYSHARNAVRNSKDGDLGTIGDEPSTLSCIETPYPFVGHVSLPDDKILLFSGDGTSSEVGIGDPANCSYTKLYSDNCLKFSVDHPITGVAKKDFQKGVVVTFTDKNNPVRRLELKKISKYKSCDEMLLFKKLDQPCITVKKGQSGSVPNGTYSVAVAYAVDKQLFSDFFSVTNRIQLYSENNSNSLEIVVNNLDSEFSDFMVVVIGNYIDPTTKGATKIAKNIGTFSTKLKKISVTDFINPTYQEVELSQLVIKKNSWQRAGIISSNSNYLFLGDLVARDEENYQLKAMGIKAQYYVEQVPVDYYEYDGLDVGYYRDENYDFYIQGVYNTGELTDKFHIPGRVASADEMKPIASADVYEFDKADQQCNQPDKVKKWQVMNTAGKLISANNDFVCNRRVLGHGKLGYFESTDNYADNPAMFGQWANTPIRYHKMPDECKVPRYSVIKGKTYVNILGIKFTDIPKFNSPDIIGYKITRSDRKGGNGTVVARGLMTHVRSYTDKQTGDKVMYTNYTVNDLSPDQYLSSTQTSWKNGSEHNFTPLTDYYNDRFNFYSPHTLFEPRYQLGSEIKLETEEIADVKGQFEIVHNHPKQKLMNQFSFWLSAAVGFIEASLIILGRNNHVQKKDNVISALGASAGTAQIFTAEKTYNISTVDDLMSLDIVGLITSKILAADPSAFSDIKLIIQIIESAAVKIPYSILGGIKEANEIFDIIYNFTGYTDYVYQYNSVATFNRAICVEDGNKRRRVDRSLYIPSDIVTIDDQVYNNYFREKTTYLELNKPVADPRTKDNSRQTMSQFGVCSSKDWTKSTGSAFYATSKVPNPNQYGRLGSSAPVSMHSCTLTFGESETAETPILYGGDCIIARFQFMKKMQFFNQNIANTNYPDGTEFDYRLYRNIGYPRFWMDSTKYDFSTLISKQVMNFTKFSRTTTGKYNLDCKKKNDGKSISRIDDAHMYLSNNAAMDFIVECDYNINFREKTEKPFYNKNNNNLSQIFRSDRLESPEEFNISRVYGDIYTTEIYAQQQREDFDPSDPIPVAQENAVIYSLPSFNLQTADNWQYFLPANYFSFRESDFGSLTGIHKLDQDRLIFLFSKSSPYISMGRDFLELEGSGRKVTVGDAGIFAQDPREIMPTDNNYGSCNSRFAFSNTHLGRYYPSASQGRILNYTENLDDITRQGISYWCKNYMPIFLYDHFPSYPKAENPLGGVGYLSAFDSFNETVYISKRDFVPKKEYLNEIEYREGGFYYRNRPVSLRDSNFFNDVSWTLSYSPLDKAFVSWHDWHPDWIIQTDNHFMSVKNNVLYKHNERYDSFCNFYGVDYPFELEVLSTSGQMIEIVRSLEYLLEVYTYKNYGRDRFHLHHENFDRLIVHNTEQISPILNLKYGNPNPEENLSYPKKDSTTPVSYDITFFKEENKYRINQFWDSTKDRGEFTNKQYHLYPTDESGYKQVLNPQAIDINKPEEQRKKFRHYWTKFRLIKTVPGDKKFIFKLLNIKKQISIR